ncbi:MAG: MarC family protein, partial [Thermoanaerobaculia bacterium]
VFALMCAISYLFFVSGEKLVTYIGENAVSVVTRLMGLILAVIGVQMFIDGVYGAVRAYS